MSKVPIDNVVSGVLVIDKPISTKDCTLENRQELIHRVRQVIIRNYDVYRETGAASIKDVQQEMKTAP